MKNKGFTPLEIYVSDGVQKNRKKSLTGFTLIEVLLAIFIIAIGVLAAFALLNQTLAFISISSARLVAAYLAQEGIEIVRNIRDTNWLELKPWDEGLTTCAAGCEADYTMSQNLDSWVDEGRYLNIDPAGFYSYLVSPNPTKFKRKITITPDGLDILKVLVEVSWQERGRTHQVTSQANLYNWR